MKMYIKLKPHPNAETYSKMKARHVSELQGTIPAVIAFTEQEFDSEVERLGLDAAEVCQLCKVEYGCFVRKGDMDKRKAIVRKHREDIAKAIAMDRTGDGFIYEMFLDELAKKGRLAEILPALGISATAVQRNKPLRHGLKKAYGTLIAQGVI